jgi:hypothetical protein
VASRAGRFRCEIQLAGLPAGRAGSSEGEDSALLLLL